MQHQDSLSYGDHKMDEFMEMFKDKKEVSESFLTIDQEYGQDKRLLKQLNEIESELQ